MSVQFGRWNLDGQPADPDYLAKAQAMLAPYGPDAEGQYIKDAVGILVRAFHTTSESREENQPIILQRDSVLTWDGRLDNRSDLIGRLKHVLVANPTDASVVGAAYEAWGTDCFAELIGDWALSIWNPRCRSVILAKDPIGTRPLFYTFDKDRITWSSILDPLALLAGRSFALEEEYIAGWLSFFPATHLTPYVGIHAVPPSCFVQLEPQGRTVRKYWDFDPEKRIRYRSDAEYEEHFRNVFAEAVRRRLRSDSPVLAELSGGMDSSSIVCMADAVIARGMAETPRLDTVSYYNDSEPGWNERPYFTRVEAKRRRQGWHIGVGPKDLLVFERDADRFAGTPAADSPPTQASSLFKKCCSLQGNRVVLSGTGGDEVTGGVPTPIPELEDLLARAQVGKLARQLRLWALHMRKPWTHLLSETACGFLPVAFVGAPKHMRPSPWLCTTFVQRHRAALSGYPSRLKLFGALPSQQDNLNALNVLRRQLGCCVSPSVPNYEKRYPYLDRCLLEFVFAIPREQMVRPGQRRSLMRRALATIVPDEILNRKRKAFVARAPILAISEQRGRIAALSQGMATASLGIVEEVRFSKALAQAIRGHELPILSLIRTLNVEHWLRMPAVQRVLDISLPTSKEDRTKTATVELVRLS